VQGKIGFPRNLPNYGKDLAMLIKHRGFKPQVNSSAFVAPNATLIGKVNIGPKSRVMYGAVLDSEGSEIELGECSIICENAVLRATAAGDVDRPVSIGDHVFISPQTTLIGCIVESYAYMGTGATVLQGATIHKGAVVAVGALVHANATIPEEFFVPPNAIAIGDPVRIFSPDEKEILVDAIRSIGFSKVAFNVDPHAPGRSSVMRKATEVRSKEFESHFSDEILP
jgi:carbonic anhydrase/acetyltransferase-like protein (isoleucine patch superfamily)